MLRAILAGGLSAGILDLTSALVLYGSRGTALIRIPQSIASGILGADAYRGGLLTAALGTLLHFVIAFSAAAVYCLASRRLPFLKDYAFVCGPTYGILVYLVMKLIVVPLSNAAIPNSRGPFPLDSVVEGLLVHVFLVGLPIAVCLHWWGD